MRKLAAERAVLYSRKQAGESGLGKESFMEAGLLGSVTQAQERVKKRPHKQCFVPEDGNLWSYGCFK